MGKAKEPPGAEDFDKGAIWRFKTFQLFPKLAL